MASGGDWVVQVGLKTLSLLSKVALTDTQVGLSWIREFSSASSDTASLAGVLVQV